MFIHIDSLSMVAAQKGLPGNRTGAAGLCCYRWLPTWNLLLSPLLSLRHLQLMLVYQCRRIIAQLHTAA